MQRAIESNSNPTNRGARAPPALDIERPALTQPYKDFVAKGWITKLTLVMEPGSTSVKVDILESILKGRKDGASNTSIAPGIAKQYIIDAGLWSPGNGKQGKAKKSEELPKRSICKKDFEGNDNQLKARIIAVASAIGDERARGRIGSLKMMIKGVDSFDAWWKKADNEAKIRLVADKKSIEQLDPSDLVRFGRVQAESPFRGVVPTPTEEEQGQDEEEEEPEDEAPQTGNKRLAVRSKK